MTPHLHPTLIVWTRQLINAHLSLDHGAPRLHNQPTSMDMLKYWHGNDHAAQPGVIPVMTVEQRKLAQIADMIATFNPFADDCAAVMAAVGRIASEDAA